jgi:hypothetical protein
VSLSAITASFQIARVMPDCKGMRAAYLQAPRIAPIKVSDTSL